MPINRPRIRVRTKQTVLQKHTTDPFVGYEHPTKSPEGWLYDSKRWCSTFDLRLPQLPRLSDGVPQGVKTSEFFLSGVGDVEQGDLEVLEFNEYLESNERHWIPLIRAGHYYHYNKSFYYYSDDSRVQYTSTSDNIDERNVLLLDYEPNQKTPITAATYKRNTESGAVDYLFQVEQRYNFSGTYTDGEENETVSDLGKINWDNVDYEKKEFIIDHTSVDKVYLMFNRDFIAHYGVTPVSLQDLSACEFLGMSNGTKCQVMYLRHFPIISDSFHLYVTASGSWTEWIQADSWFDLTNTTAIPSINRYYLDKDLGIVYFASAVENSIPLLGESVVCQYDTTLRVEYEEEGDDLLLNAWDADISPLSQYVNQGFICITNQQLEPAYIRLSIDKRQIPFTSNPREYGPITVGSDFALLKANVTSYDDIPVPGIEVIFTMDPSEAGYLAGGSTSQGVTDGKGNAYTSYQPPISADALGYYLTNEASLPPLVRASTHASYTNHKDVIIPRLDVNMVGQEAQTYIYQILKDDLLSAYDNVEDWIDDNLTQPPWVIDATTEAIWKNEVKEEYELKDWFEVNTASGIKPDGTIDGRKVVLYKTVAATHKTTEPKGVISNGTDNFDSEAIDPSVDTTEDPIHTGAIVPIRPELIEIIDDISDPYNGHTRLIYPEDALPTPDPVSTSNNTGGYWVVATKIVNFQAYCWSSMYNRYIYSNKIAARLSLPDYLLGEYVNEQLKKIPFGWKLIVETDNVAAGLNGATFLTVNPISGPYKIIDLINGFNNDDWASAPFKSLAFQVKPPEA